MVDEGKAKSTVDVVLEGLCAGKALRDVAPRWDAPTKTAGIYVLLGDGVPYYVGQSKNVARRSMQHTQAWHLNTCSLPKAKKTAKLLQNGHKVECIIVDTGDDLDALECLWISVLREAGFRLANVSDGGASMNHLREGKMRMPWYPHQAPFQKALIAMRDYARRYGDERVGKQADILQEKLNKLKRDPIEYIVRNLELVARRPSAKTWKGKIKIGDSWHG